MFQHEQGEAVHCHPRPDAEPGNGPGPGPAIRTAISAEMALCVEKAFGVSMGMGMFFADASLA